MRLLGTVDEPESLLAITFTRKAAAEMRARVLELIDPDYVPAPHEVSAYGAARAITERLIGWDLLANPQRLQIRTIDSFNHSLARQMPLASQLGPVPTPADDVMAQYRRAVRRVLSSAAGDPVADAVQTLLSWRDHNRQQVEDVLAGLLAGRERWLRAIGLVGGVERVDLEAELGREVERSLAHVRDLLDTSLDALELTYAKIIEALGRAQAEVDEPTFTGTLQASIDDLDSWRCLADALLVAGKAHFRKRIDKRQGFPPKSPQLELWKPLLATLGEAPDRYAALAEALHRCRKLPNPRYADDEWAVLQAVIEVMRRCAAELSLQFASSGRCDFTAIAAAALAGLGDPDRDGGVTDLALILDHKIQHILVDEFQDTNLGQMRLLERLTTGWEPGDGRTLFAVGDPMQSIYRFREAEVGLFLDARANGVGGVALEALTLNRNFRCAPAIVNWVNQVLGPVFPEQEDAVRGAVTYAPSEAGVVANTAEPGGEVVQRGFASDESEAAWIVEHLQQALSEHQGDEPWRAAIIVRSRSHLKALLPTLADAGVRYRAVKLTPLLDEPVVQDLLALTALLSRRTDRTALLGLLRSPLVGLTLADLSAFSNGAEQSWAVAEIESLSDDGRLRAERAIKLLEAALGRLGKQSLAHTLEGLWSALGGPEVWSVDPADARNVRRYLDLLATAENDGTLEDWNAFIERLDVLKTEGDEPSDDVRLDLLTVHSAKGLEWDLVFLPGLARQPPPSKPALLHWLPQGRNAVLMAPQRRADVQASDQNPLIGYMADEEKEREQFERQRLFYVAATRAKKALVLTASMQVDEKSGVTKPPHSGSQLKLIWDHCDRSCFEIDPPSPSDETVERRKPDQALRRVPSGWVPTSGDALTWRHAREPAPAGDEVEYNWAGAGARRIGTVLHRLLEQVGRDGIERFDAERRQRLLARIPALLGREGIAVSHGDAVVAAVAAAFEQTLDDERGAWLLSNQHREARCELPVSGVVDGVLVNRVIDRTFVDADGTRWIVDYKSGEREGGDLEGFIAEEAVRYRDQLAEYATLMQALDGRPVRSALYLTRYQRLVEVPL